MVCRNTKKLICAIRHAKSQRAVGQEAVQPLLATSSLPASGRALACEAQLCSRPAKGSPASLESPMPPHSVPLSHSNFPCPHPPPGGTGAWRLIGDGATSRDGRQSHLGHPAATAWQIPSGVHTCCGLVGSGQDTTRNSGMGSEGTPVPVPEVPVFSVFVFVVIVCRNPRGESHRATSVPDGTTPAGLLPEQLLVCHLDTCKLSFAAAPALSLPAIVSIGPFRRPVQQKNQCLPNTYVLHSWE